MLMIHSARPVHADGEPCDSQWLLNVTTSDGRRVEGVLVRDPGGSDFSDLEGDAIDLDEADWETLATAEIPDGEPWEWP